MSQLVAHRGAELVTREQLGTLVAPESTSTHQVIPHIQLVNSLIETLSFRHINVVRDEYAVTPDGNRMFGVMELELSFDGCRISIGLRNSHDKTMRLGLTVGYRVMVCDNLMFRGDYTPVSQKHTKRFSLQNALAIGVDDMQRHFEPLKNQVQQWRTSQITDEFARLVIYKAFIEEKLAAPKHLAREVHRQYFEPTQEDFQGRTMWSLSNAFTGALKLLDPIPQHKSTADLGRFLGDLTN